MGNTKCRKPTGFGVYTLFTHIELTNKRAHRALERSPESEDF